MCWNGSIVFISQLFIKWSFRVEAVNNLQHYNIEFLEATPICSPLSHMCWFVR